MKWVARMLSAGDCGSKTLEGVATGSIARGAELMPCGVQLRYSANNPYVVTVTAAAPEIDGSKWCLSRDLEYTHALVPFGSEALLGGIDDALDGILGEE
jgi:hypothetical protein